MLKKGRQIYDYYLMPYLNCKGQDLVEYALLLAIVVGIGYAIFQFGGVKESIKSIFDSTNYVLDLVWKMVPFTTRVPSNS